MTSSIDNLYQTKIRQLRPHERMERCVAMGQWSRELIGRQIVKEQGPMSPERLRLLVARRIYASVPFVVAYLDERLRDVPH